MGASKRPQMRRFEDGWPDRIWEYVCAMNNGHGAGWLLPLAAIAVTGCRPSALERGISFTMGNVMGEKYIEALIPGSKITKTRGQPSYTIRWCLGDSHRPEEIDVLARALMRSPSSLLMVRYSADAISTRLREVSKTIWPRRRFCITAYCYRELLSATAKAARVNPVELARALGHRSTESQGAYSSSRSMRKITNKPWGMVTAPINVVSTRSPMARFKAAASLRQHLRKNQL